MKFAVGSASERKINTARKIISEHLTQEFEIVGSTAKSGVPETPWDKQTYDGAKNRASAAKAAISDADYAIGLESGLINRYGNVYEEAWCCVIDKNGKEFFGFSSGLKVPDYILNKMNESNLEHNQAMTILERQHNLLNADTWGTYSGNKILREISLEEALRNTLIQVFASDKSFYKKD